MKNRISKEKFPVRLRSKSSRATYYAEHVGWHIQNLNDGKDGVLGSIYRHGRVWLHFGEPSIQLYWSFGGRFFHLRMELGGGDSGREVSFSLGLPFVGLFVIDFDKFLSDRWFPGKMVDSHVRPGTQFKMPEERWIGIGVVGKTICVYLWYNPDEWQGSDPWWWRLSWNPIDEFFGRAKYSEREISSSEEMLSLPETNYPVRVRIFESAWKRPRWFRARRLLRAEVEADSPIPFHAGKGESEWDLEDDALLSITLCADSVAEALEKTVASILRDRKRYGTPIFE